VNGSVLYKQMLAWMLYGEILDPFDEFFIKRDDSKRPGSSSATLQQNEHHHEASGVPSDAFRWQRQFSMDLNAVPTLYFPPAVAEKVFFIGKAVHILSLSNELTPAEAHEIARIMSQVAQRREFDALVLEQAVERIRVEIARRLHDLVVVRSGFARFLEMLKDFFLLTRGEIFHAFIERSFLQMLQKPTSKSEDDINYGMWQPTVREFTPTVGVSDKVDQTSAWVQRFRLKVRHRLECFCLCSTDMHLTNSLLLACVAIRVNSSHSRHLCSADSRRQTTWCCLGSFEAGETARVWSSRRRLRPE
jgi:hypothetical protein